MENKPRCESHALVANTRGPRFSFHQGQKLINLIKILCINVLLKYCRRKYPYVLVNQVEDCSIDRDSTVCLVLITLTSNVFLIAIIILISKILLLQTIRYSYL